jgi:uroporphyrinogen decarboxylase
MQDKMTSRDRLKAILGGGIPDRIGMHESPWGETIDLWHTQGLPEKVSVHDYFGMDIASFGGLNLSFRFPGQTIEDTPEYTIIKDGNGVTAKRFKKKSGFTPHWIDHVIKGQKEWDEHGHRLVPMPERLPKDIKQQAEKTAATKRFLALGHADPYELAWPVFGQAQIWMLMMDDPDFVGRVMMTYADLIIGLYKLLDEQGVQYDGVFMPADLGYRNATLFSPKLYERLIFPAHKKLVDYQHERGRHFMCHSCGKIDVLIPKFIEAGFDAIQPLEAKCGQDVRVLKKLYAGKITLFGNIDIRKLSGTKKDVEEEVVSKVEAAKVGGGYIFHSDHSVPPTVSFENYCYAVELAKEHGQYQQ